MLPVPEFLIELRDIPSTIINLIEFFPKSLMGSLFTRRKGQDMPPQIAGFDVPQPQRWLTAGGPGLSEGQRATGAPLRPRFTLG